MQLQIFSSYAVNTAVSPTTPRPHKKGGGIHFYCFFIYLLFSRFSKCRNITFLFLYLQLYQRFLIFDQLHTEWPFYKIKFVIVLCINILYIYFNFRCLVLKSVPINNSTWTDDVRSILKQSQRPHAEMV